MLSSLAYCVRCISTKSKAMHKGSMLAPLWCHYWYRRTLLALGRRPDLTVPDQVIPTPILKHYRHCRHSLRHLWLPLCQRLMCTANQSAIVGRDLYLNIVPYAITNENAFSFIELFRFFDFRCYCCCMEPPSTSFNLLAFVAIAAFYGFVLGLLKKPTLWRDCGMITVPPLYI